MSFLKKLESLRLFIFDGVGANTFLKRFLRMILMIIGYPILVGGAFVVCFVTFFLMIVASPFVYLFTGENILEEM